MFEKGEVKGIKKIFKGEFHDLNKKAAHHEQPLLRETAKFSQHRLH